MKTGNRSNALLVELLIVVMFFMLAATVLLQVFSAASDQGSKAGRVTQALVSAQNVAERLYAADAPETALVEMGFTRQGNIWTRDDGDYVVEAVVETQDRPYGMWFQQEVRVEAAGERLFTLPCSRYEEARP
ncbi:MAG: hypothetical protein IJ157_04305 [Clostridia bacterium]|nr:hypothetical protein [Clostridia bacterium]